MNEVGRHAKIICQTVREDHVHERTLYQCIEMEYGEMDLHEPREDSGRPRLGCVRI